jgi:hypothetical protein
MHYHADHGIRHHGVWEANPRRGIRAEGKDRLSATIGWSVRDDHILMMNCRNDFGPLSQQLFGNVWRLEFNYKGGLFFTDNADVLADVGTGIYRSYQAALGVRNAQLALGMHDNTMADDFDRLCGVLLAESQAQGEKYRNLVYAGLGLNDRIQSDGGYLGGWDKARIVTEVDRLGIPRRTVQREVEDLLCSLAQVP